MANLLNVRPQTAPSASSHVTPKSAPKDASQADLSVDSSLNSADQQEFTDALSAELKSSGQVQAQTANAQQAVTGATKQAGIAQVAKESVQAANQAAVNQTAANQTAVTQKNQKQASEQAALLQASMGSLQPAIQALTQATSQVAQQQEQSAMAAVAKQATQSKNSKVEIPQQSVSAELLQKQTVLMNQAMNAGGIDPTAVQDFKAGGRAMNAADLSKIESQLGLGMDGMDLSALRLSDDANVLAMDGKVGMDAGKAGVSAFSTTQAAQKPTAATSTLSTDEYLNLRSFATGMKKTAGKLSLNTAELGGASAQPINLALNGNDQQNAMRLPTVDAPVTQGSGSRLVLSHDALHQITNQVNTMNLARQDGEIKIRMKPDHLGELQMKVTNHGQAISIQIMAQDPGAKHIIESSLSSLRDSFAQQNLTLARIDVTQAPAPVSQDGASMNMDTSQFRQQSSDFGAQQQQHQESMANRNYWRDEDSGTARVVASQNALWGKGATRGQNVSTQGLDLIA